MADTKLTIGNKLYDCIQFSENKHGNMFVSVEDYNGEVIGKHIKKEDAKQIIDHLKTQFEL